VVTRRVDPQAAPEPLERVRELLNSWRIPNDTRTPTDLFDRFLRSTPTASPPERAVLRALRDDLRACLEQPAKEAARLNAWIARLAVAPVVAEGAIRFGASGGLPGRLLAIVLCAVADGRWGRLKACPDCHWVFYDYTRNGSKRWCLMNAGGPQGRACGTIAKVRRYRERNRGRRRAR
jgi:predicted RNA-binding Zn ribbon-like protein